jgi:hypothetical protein
MSADLFKRTRSLLRDHVKLLQEHKLGDSHSDEAEAIIEEIDILLKSGEVGNIEKRIDVAERQALSDDLADEILNGKYCVGGNCDD